MQFFLQSFVLFFQELLKQPTLLVQEAMYPTYLLASLAKPVHFFPTLSPWKLYIKTLVLVFPSQGIALYSLLHGLKTSLIHGLTATGGRFHRHCRTVAFLLTLTDTKGLEIRLVLSLRN